jgi:hypothetical protein
MANLDLKPAECLRQINSALLILSKVGSRIRVNANPVTIRNDRDQNKFAFTTNFWLVGTFSIEDLGEGPTMGPTMAHNWAALISSLLTLVPVPVFAQEISAVALAGFSAVPYA